MDPASREGVEATEREHPEAAVGTAVATADWAVVDLAKLCAGRVRYSRAEVQVCWVGEDVLVESLLVLGELVVHEEAAQGIGVLLWDGPVLARPQFLRSGVLLSAGRQRTPAPSAAFAGDRRAAGQAGWLRRAHRRRRAEAVRRARPRRIVKVAGIEHLDYSIYCTP